MNTFRKTALATALAFALPALAHAGTVSKAQALANLQADAQALQSAEYVATTLVAVGQSYGDGFAPYVSTDGAGRGPLIALTTLDPVNHKPGTVLCRNPTWVAATHLLALGGLNVAGNAMALGYTLQVLATHWSQDLIELMDAEGSTGSANTQQVIDLNQQATQALSTLLNEVGTQTSAAMNPNTTTLAYMPSGQATGVGDVPVPTGVQLSSAGNNAAPLGWATLPEVCHGKAGCVPVVTAPLPNVCPTYSASIPMQNIGQMTEAMAQQAIADEPSMSGLLGPIIGASKLAVETQTVTASNDQSYTFVAPDYIARIALVGTLRKDVVGAANYVQPILASMHQFNALAQQITTEVSQP